MAKAKICLFASDSNDENKYSQIQNSFKNFIRFDKVINDYLIVLRINKKGYLTYVNAQFCEISHYALDEALGRPYSLITKGQFFSLTFEDFWEEINHKKSWRGEIKNKTKDGNTYWLDGLVFPVENMDQEVNEYLIVCHDITDKKEREKQVNESEKLALVGETTAQIFHDVMNPLTVILLSAQKMKKKLLTEIDPKPLDTIVSSVKKVQKMFQEVRNVLYQGEQDFKKEEQRANLNQIINKTMELVSLKLEEHNVKVNYSDCHEKISVIGSELQFTQVFVNLINNSVDAIEGLDERWIHLKVVEMGRFVHVAITDSGQGIPGNIQEKIFKNLFSTKKKVGGTGLGLGICRKIMRRYGGDVNINKMSKNTSFIISLKRG